MPKRKFSSSTMKNATAYAYRKRRRRVRSTARKALTMVKEVKKMVNKTIENKQVSALRPSIFVTNAGYNAITVGDTIQPTMRQGVEDGSQTVGSSSRIGNSITLMRTQLKFMFDVASTSETYNKFRLILVESTEGNNAIGAADVLESPTQPMTSLYTTKTNTNKRYKIWLDKVFEVNRNAHGSKYIEFVKHYGKTGRVVDYSGSPETPTNYNLNILCFSDSTVAPHPSMEYCLRHSYKDA
jgi:hypothetical protein